MVLFLDIVQVGGDIVQPPGDLEPQSTFLACGYPTYTYARGVYGRYPRRGRGRRHHRRRPRHHGRRRHRG